MSFLYQDVLFCWRRIFSRNLLINVFLLSGRCFKLGRYNSLPRIHQVKYVLNLDSTQFQYDWKWPYKWIISRALLYIKAAAYAFAILDFLNNWMRMKVLKIFNQREALSLWPENWIIPTYFMPTHGKGPRTPPSSGSLRRKFSHV